MRRLTNFQPDAVLAAESGDTILVSGTCRESVFIQPEMTRIVLIGLKLGSGGHVIRTEYIQDTR